MSQQPKATREHARLEEIRSKQVPWRKWGPYLSERQWGGVRENLNKDVEAWNDVTHDQSRSRAYLSGEDGIAGFCDDKMLLCLSLGALERQGSDPQGADVRPHQQRGQSRRGRQGVLLLSRQHADALVREDALQVPAGGVPLRRPGGGEPAPLARPSSSTSCWTPACSTRTATGTCSSSSPRPTPRTSRIRITAVNRGPEAATLHLLPHLWFRNTWWVDAQAPRPELTARHHDKCAGHRRQAPGSSGSAFSTATAPVELLFTDNETNRYRLWGQPNPTQFQKDGINDYVVQRAPGRRQSRRRRGPSPRPTRSSTCEPGQSATVRLRLSDAAARRSRRSVRPLRPDLRRPQAGGGRVLRATHPAVAERRRRERHPPGLRRAALDQAGLRLRRGAMAERARRPARLEQQHPQPALVPHVQRRRHLDAGQVGVPLVRRLGSGVSRDVAGVRRSRVRRRSAGAHAARPVPAPERPAPGLRVELRRRQPARARLGGALQLPPQPRKPGRRGDPVPEAHLQHACWPTSPGGSTARTATAATCSRAASWASTTSASSIAARRCRPAATSSRPTARPGWRSTPRTCSTSRSSSRSSTRRTKTWRSSSTST